MSLRNTLTTDLKSAMRAQEKMRLKTLRLIQTEIKRADIALKTDGKGDEIDEPAILALLQKMIKQRQDTIKIYLDKGRDAAADAESQEIAVIEDYLPKMKSQAQTQALIAATIADLGAEGMKDMGKVIGALKAAHPGALDMGLTSSLVKAALGA